MEKRGVSPIGRTVTEGAARRRERSAAYRAAEEKFARAHEVAKLVIHLRTELGLTQEEVAKGSGTSYSQISRIESGRHDVNTRTLHRVFRALGARYLIGYELPSRKGRAAQRELIAI